MLVFTAEKKIEKVIPTFYLTILRIAWYELYYNKT